MRIRKVESCSEGTNNAKIEHRERDHADRVRRRYRLDVGSIDQRDLRRFDVSEKNKRREELHGAARSDRDFPARWSCGVGEEGEVVALRKGRGSQQREKNNSGVTHQSLLVEIGESCVQDTSSSHARGAE